MSIYSILYSIYFFHTSDENYSASTTLLAAQQLLDVTLACEDDPKEGGGAQLCG